MDLPPKAFTIYCGKERHEINYYVEPYEILNFCQFHMLLPGVMQYNKG